MGSVLRLLRGRSAENVRPTVQSIRKQTIHFLVTEHEKMRFDRRLSSVLPCFILCICLLTGGVIGGDEWSRPRGSARSVVSSGQLVSTSILLSDSADLAIVYNTAYPGASHQIEAQIKTPESIAGFGLEVVIDPPELADFTTVRIYVDSMDTCPAEEETCWQYFPIRECQIEPGTAISDWSFLEAHGAPGDTTQSFCDTVRILGLALYGDPILPDPNYQSLLRLGVDAACISDSLAQRTVKFSMTGELSDPSGQPVPLRAQPGNLTIWWSVPGDANNDSLVNVGDVVFLVNYLYKTGSQPCVMEAADPNADCKVDVGDVVYLINFLYRNGTPPSAGCAR
jgi:hypothetical protein